MDKQLKALDRVFKALADPTRLRIIGLLLTGEVCVCHVHDTLGIPQPKASRHLAYLRRCGLVETRRDGLWIYYRLAGNRDPVVAAVERAVQHAITHVPGIRRDLVKLQKQNGCGAPVASSEPRPCCPPVAVPVSLVTRA